MNEIKKMLKAVINGQSTLKQELLQEIRRVEQKLDSKIDDMRSDLKDVEKNLTSRIDSIGRQVAYLEDDTPTRDEFGDSEKRVKKIEQKTSISHN